MTLDRVARITASNPDDFRFALREFFREAAQARDRRLIARSPGRTSRPEYDAYLAAVAEGTALRFGWPIPRWVRAQHRVLHRPYFGNAPAGMKIPLLQESPACFRKRNIFVDNGELEDNLRRYEPGGPHPA